MRGKQVLVSCEHASAAIPRWARSRLDGVLSSADKAALQQALADHRGSDPGAGPCSQALGRRLGCPVVLGQASRLLVDLNRSPKHPARFSTFTRRCPEDLRLALHQRLWWPHWQAIGRHVAGARATLHFALHSFDPALAIGRDRIDVGLLYDPARAGERRVAALVLAAIAARAPELRLRRNAPYRGVSDGLPTALRRRLSPACYVGFELEVSQALVHDARWAELQAMLVDALASVAEGEISRESPDF